MTTPSELADDLEKIVEHCFDAEIVVGLRNNLPTILSALRRVEKMEGALERIAHPPYGLGFNKLRGIARQALTGEA